MPLTLPSISPADAATDNAAIITTNTHALHFIALFSFALNSKYRSLWLENESGDKIHGIVGIRISARAVIVRVATIEACVPGVLCRELQVLPRPVGEVRDVTGPSRIAARTSTYSRLREQDRIDGPAGIEP